MYCLNILNPQSINFKFTNCFLWHQLLALFFIKTCGCLLIVYFSSVPTVTAGYDFKNICLFKEIFTSYRYFTSLEQVTHFCPVSLIYVLISKPLPRLLVAILSQQGHKKKRALQFIPGQERDPAAPTEQKWNEKVIRVCCHPCQTIGIDSSQKQKNCKSVLKSRDS